MARTRKRLRPAAERLEPRTLLTGQPYLAYSGPVAFYHSGDELASGGTGFKAFSNVTRPSTPQTERFEIYQSTRPYTNDSLSHHFDLVAGIAGQGGGSDPASYLLTIDGETPGRPVDVAYVYQSDYQTFRKHGGSFDATVDTAVALGVGNYLYLNESTRHVPGVSREETWDSAYYDRFVGHFTAKTGDTISLMMRAKLNGDSRGTYFDLVPQLTVTLTPREVQTDLSVDAVTQQASPDQIAVDYTVHDWDLKNPATVAFYWSGDATLDPSDQRLDGYDLPTETMQGSYTIPSVYLPPAYLRPDWAQYVVVTIMPDAGDDEANFSNNTIAYSLSTAPPPRTDLVVTSLTANTASGGVDYGYAVNNTAPPQGTAIALYWSPTSSFEPATATPVVGTGVAVTPAGGTTAGTVTAHVDDSVLAATPRPAGTRYLLAVADPPSTSNPYGLIDESDEANNVRALLVGADLTADALAWSAGAGTATLAYTVGGQAIPQPATVELYWASSPAYADRIGPPVRPPWQTQTARGSYQIFVPNDSTASLKTPPSGATHLLLVVNGNQTVDEVDPTNGANNLFALSLIDLAATDLSWNPDGTGVQFSYEVASNLAAGATAGLYWASGESFDQRRGGPASSVVSNGSDAPIALVTLDGTAGAHGPVVIPNLGPRPAGASHLLIVLDPPVATHPAGLIAEGDETNNVRALYIPIAPTLQLIVPPAGTLMKDPYTVQLVITNNDIQPLTFEYSLKEDYVSIPAPVETALDRSQTVQTITLQPGVSQTVTFGPVSRSWEWIPRDVQSAGEHLKEITDDIVTEMETHALEQLLPRIATYAGNISSALAIFHDFVSQSLVAHNTADIRYTALVRYGPTDTQSQATVLRVPDGKQQAYISFKINSALATASTDLALSFLVVPPAGIPISIALFLSEVLIIGIANVDHEQAVDPPDSDYTRLASPVVVSMPELDQLPPGLWKDYAQSWQELLAVETAWAASRDRAQGAEAAGDTAWQATQLIAAAEWSSRAAVLQSHLADLQDALTPVMTSVLGAHQADVTAYLRDRGLPELEVRYLTQAGWTAAEVEHLRQELIDAVPATARATGVLADAIRVASLASAVGANDALARGIQLRLSLAGQSVQNLAPAQRQDLDAARAAITAGVTRGTPSDALRSQIESFLAQVRQLVTDTGNLAALREDLDFGYLAEIRFHMLQTTPSGLGGLLDRLQSSGALGEDLAGTLRSQAVSAQNDVEAGAFGHARTVLDGLAARVASVRGTTLSTDVADQILSYAGVVRALLGPADLVSGDTTGPTVTSLVRTGLGSQPTRLVLHFSEPLDATHASDPASYVVVAPGRDGKLGTRDDVRVPIVSVVYLPSDRTVTLTTAQRLGWTAGYRVQVDGTSQASVADTAGNRLDGDGDGQAGGNFTAVFHGAGAFPSPAPSGLGTGPDAYVTSLYNQLLARTPEPSGLAFWSGELAAKVNPATVAASVWNSRERRMLLARHAAPPVSLGAAVREASRAWAKAVRSSARAWRPENARKPPRSRPRHSSVTVTGRPPGAQ